MKQKQETTSLQTPRLLDCRVKPDNDNYASKGPNSYIESLFLKSKPRRRIVLTFLKGEFGPISLLIKKRGVLGGAI